MDAAAMLVPGGGEARRASQDNQREPKPFARRPRRGRMCIDRHCNEPTRRLMGASAIAGGPLRGLAAAAGMVTVFGGTPALAQCASTNTGFTGTCAAAAATGGDSTAVGQAANATGTFATAYGNAAVAFGIGATATGGFSVAIGNSATATGVFTIANGARATPTRWGHGADRAHPTA